MRVFFHRLRVERLTYSMRLDVARRRSRRSSLAAWRAPQAHWAALLTALVGMAAGGGMIWIVRVIGAATLGREAMGFGDVTLMSMIGAFVGWQGSLIVFFLAPIFRTGQRHRAMDACTASTRFPTDRICAWRRWS